MGEELSVVIAGCGPAAMMIAHASEQMNVPFRLIAPKKPSFISGAQYLHRDVGVRAEGLQPRSVRYVRRGTEAVYKQKIYGSRGLPEGMVTSWGQYPDEVQAWPLQAIYNYLWERYASEIKDCTLTADDLVAMAMVPSTLVFNTAPLDRLLPNYFFWSESVWITNEMCFAEPDTIVYNGQQHNPWYRSSNLDGFMSTEYPGHFPPSELLGRLHFVEIKKPLRSDAVLPGVILSGRYGRWEKGVLVDESYFQALDEIKARL